jgi:hypothetical protein
MVTLLRDSQSYGLHINHKNLASCTGLQLSWPSFFFSVCNCWRFFMPHAEVYYLFLEVKIETYRHSIDSRFNVPFRCSSCYSVSKEHLKGPSISTCLSRCWKAMLRNNGTPKSLLEYIVAQQWPRIVCNNDLLTLLYDNGNRGYCWDTLLLNNDLKSRYCKNDLCNVEWRSPFECQRTRKSTPFQYCKIKWQLPAGPSSKI